VTCIQKKKGKVRNDKNISHLPAIMTIPDELWDEIKKVLPKERPPSKTVGRPIVKYRKVLDGILYVLRTEGCQWKMIPKEYGSGSTCHRRFQEWNILSIFKKTWIKLLKIYDKEMGINWTWQSIDSISVKAPLGGAMTGNNPTNRSKLGTKRHILTDKDGISLSTVISPASTHDIKLVTDLVDNTVINRKNDDEDNDHQYINLNWKQEKDCNIYVLTKHTFLNKKNRN
jgi:transposase